ncbi:ATG9 [Symbiodinium necroappetens]|uniref:Autophagy-related protein 9 n=1 Tax=Symbiodinium necroappetens TaxID=1628268 RepID=A0A813CEB7_9DINO|nr:ATG9 [Symbiodinium necroappetens]
MYERLTDGPPEPVLDRWDAKPDLERFLTCFYRYFEVKGLRGVVAIHLSHVVALAFTIGFSFVLLFLIDWEALLACDSEESCRSISIYYAKPFRDLGFRRAGVLVCTVLFVFYGAMNVATVYQDIRDAQSVSTYYKDRLGIAADESLETMTWSEVVSRLVQQQKESRFCIVQDELTALEIANIIMREDNFMIGLTSHKAFTEGLPCWIPRRLVFTKAVFWNLRLVIFRWQGVLDDRGRIRRDFLNRPEALARNLRLLGLANLVLVPPVLIFVALYFFMRHAEEFRSQRASPFQRQWTDYAQWTFREYNELPHEFNARMCAAQAAAEAYVHCTTPSSPVLKSVQRCVKFIAGSVLAALLLVALWDDTPLLFVKVQEKNLLWYLAFFGFAFAVADGAGDEDAGSGGSGASHAPSMPLRMHIALMRLVSCTHYLPEHWRSPARLTSLAGACSGLQRAELCDHFRRVRRELLRDFSLQRIQALAEELLGVLLSPILLMFFLPDVARNIIGALGSLQHSSPNLGDWCLYGCLDSAIVAENSGGAASSAEGCQSVQLLNRYGDTNEKLEKSVLSFCLNHQLVWPSSTDRINSETFQAPSHPPRAHQARNLGRQMMPTSTASRAARPLWPGHGHQDIQLEELNSLSTSQTSPPDLQGDDENGALSPQSQAVADTEPLIDLDSHQDSANDVPAQRGTTSPVARKEQVLTHIIGVPPSAINLLNDIQDFHEKETSEDPLSGEKVALLPPDLVKLPPLAPGPTALAATAVGRIGDEPEWSNTCGPWFYWLEALRAFKARRFDESSSGCGMFNRQPHGVQSHSRTERLAALA